MKNLIVLMLLLLQSYILPGIKPITVWLQSNDWPLGVQSIGLNRDVISVVSPAWYWALADGSVVPIDPNLVDDKNLTTLTQTSRIQLRPVVSNVTPLGAQPDWLRENLSTQQKRELLAQNIQRLATAKNYSGIDLDFEGLLPSELPLLAEFVTQLAPLLHQNSKTLSVNLQTTLSSTAIQPWKTIGEQADLVTVMLYSEHHERTGPGPLASLAWMRTRLELFLTAIPANKLQVGLLIVAYTWSPSAVRSGTWERLVLPGLNKGLKPNRDELNWSPWIQDGETQIWYEDQLSIQRKLELLKEYKIRKIALWRAGGEDPAIWSELNSYFDRPSRNILRR